MKAYVWYQWNKRTPHMASARWYAMELRRMQLKSGSRLSRLRVVDFGRAPKGKR